MKVSNSGAGLPSTLRTVSSVSLSVLTIWTLNSTPISWVCSAISFAYWTSAGASERTNRSNEATIPSFSRIPSSFSSQPASSRSWFASSGSYG